MRFSIETVKSDYGYTANIKELNICSNQETEFDAIRGVISILEGVLLMAEEDELKFKNNKVCN